MKVIADVCVIPMGQGASVSKEVTACEKLLRESGLKVQLHAYGTNIEGEWDEVFAVIKSRHEMLHEQGVARISTSIKVGTRTDKEQTMADKVRVVEEALNPGIPE